MKIDVVIPALNPDDKLIQLISDITSTVALSNITKGYKLNIV